MYCSVIPEPWSVCTCSHIHDKNQEEALSHQWNIYSLTASLSTPPPPQEYTSFISYLSTSPNLKPVRQPMLGLLAFDILWALESYSCHILIISVHSAFSPPSPNCLRWSNTIPSIAMCDSALSPLCSTLHGGSHCESVRDWSDYRITCTKLSNLCNSLKHLQSLVWYIRPTIGCSPPHLLQLLVA